MAAPIDTDGLFIALEPALTNSCVRASLRKGRYEVKGIGNSSDVPKA